MKKSILTLAFGLLISLVTVAQSEENDRLERVLSKEIAKIENTLTLNEKEKETYKKIKTQQLTKHFSLSKEFKASDPDMFKQKVKENSKQYTSELIEAFGKKRATEILKASRAKK